MQLSVSAPLISFMSYRINTDKACEETPPKYADVFGKIKE